MKNLWRGLTALALFGAASTSMVAGCVDAEAPFFITSVKLTQCDGTSVDSPVLGMGQMDVRYLCSYAVWLELGNQLVRRGDETKLQIETSRISVTSVDVQIFQADGVTPIQNAAGAAEFTFPTTGFVDPSTGSAPGKGIALALLVDGATGAALYDSGGGLIIARVVAHGRTLGGDDIETRPFDFPIDVCKGCLCFEPADDDCTNAASEPEAACFRPQDEAFDCRWLGVSCFQDARCGIAIP